MRLSKRVACGKTHGIVKDIREHIQVHVPFRLLMGEQLSLFIEHKLQPEISFSSFELDSFNPADFRLIAERLRQVDLPITLHAPFMDLRPGALDEKIRRSSIERFQQLFSIAPLFKPRSIVCHPAFDKRYYVSTEEQWLENSIDTWKRFLPAAETLDTVIAFENVYDTDPKMLLSLVDALDSPHARICFDTGHFNAFSQTPLHEWLEVLGARIAQLHLHDNHGINDEHLPVGEGTFPFINLFSSLHQQGNHPIITVEPHTEENLWKTLIHIKQLRLLDVDQRAHSRGLPQGKRANHN